MKVYYEDILVGEIFTNRWMTTEEALEFLDFDEAEFCRVNCFDDVDYNDFYFKY